MAAGSRYSFGMRFLPLLLLFPFVAHAELENPNLLPLGEEEAFLGNAGIAHAESTGATYYNPGALGFIRNKKVSIYGNAYLADHTYIRAQSRLNGYDVPLNSSSFSPIPLSSVTILGNERFTYAFSVHVPSSSNYQFQMPLQADTAKLALVGNISSSSLWIGPSIGKRVSEDFGWGASLYAVRYAYNATILDNVTASASSLSIAATVGQHQEMSAISAIAILGGQWRLSPVWRLGVRLQSQALNLRGSGSTYSVVSGTVNGQASTGLLNENGYDTRYRTPFQLGVGFENESLPNLELLGDVNAQFPVDYQTAPSRPSLSSRILSKFTVRGSLGAKWRLNATRSLLGGVMVNPSTIPPGGSSMGGFPDENFHGVSLGLQNDAGVLTTTLGGFFSWSSGDFNVENTGGAVKSPIEHQLYGVLMTASYKL